MSIPAPASAIRRPVTALARPSAPRPARRTSTASSIPTWSVVIGANPTDGHPVFGSRLKKRLRQGAKLIVIDPRRIDLVRTPHVEAAHHLPLQPGTNVAVLTALAHVIVTEGLFAEAFIRERCDWSEFEDWAAFVSEPAHSPEDNGKVYRRARSRAARCCPPVCHRRQWRDLLRPRCHRTQPGFDHRHGDR